MHAVQRWFLVWQIRPKLNSAAGRGRTATRLLRLYSERGGDTSDHAVLDHPIRTTSLPWP